MDFRFEISKRLSREHGDVTALLNRLEKFVQSHGSDHQPDWETFRTKCNVFVTELCSHAEKEEFGFVPAIDELMDAATAKRIFDRYLQM